MAHSKTQVLKQSEKFGEHNDCTVKALALTTKLSYEEAHEALKREGRKEGKGAYSYQWKAAFKNSGYDLVRVIDFTAKTVMGIPKDKKFKKSYKYLVRVRGHVLAVRNNEVLDWTEGRRHRIQEVYKVVPIK